MHWAALAAGYHFLGVDKDEKQIERNREDTKTKPTGLRLTNLGSIAYLVSKIEDLTDLRDYDVVLLNKTLDTETLTNEERQLIVRAALEALKKSGGILILGSVLGGGKILF